MAVKIILKNSAVEDKRPEGSGQLGKGEISLNSHDNGAFLCCVDTSGNVQQIGGIKVSNDAPGTPVKGTAWLQPSSSTFFVHDGNAWQSASGGGGGAFVERRVLNVRSFLFESVYTNRVNWRILHTTR